MPGRRPSGRRPLAGRLGSWPPFLPAAALGAIIRRQRELAELSMRSSPPRWGSPTPTCRRSSAGCARRPRRWSTRSPSRWRRRPTTLYDQAGVAPAGRRGRRGRDRRCRARSTTPPELTAAQRQALLRGLRAFLAANTVAPPAGGTPRSARDRARTAAVPGVARPDASRHWPRRAVELGRRSTGAAMSAKTGGQWSRSASWPMKMPRWPPVVVQPVTSSGRGGRRSRPGRTPAAGGVMWSLAPASRYSGQWISARSTCSPPTLSVPCEQLVVAEEVLDDPQVEGAGDGLGVLEPVLEARGSARRAGRRGCARAAASCSAISASGLHQHEAVEHERRPAARRRWRRRAPR